jgi:hypothetical protein
MMIINDGKEEGEGKEMNEGVNVIALIYAITINNIKYYR